jgi:hypothetical protein
MNNAALDETDSHHEVYEGLGFRLLKNFVNFVSFGSARIILADLIF